MATWPKDKLIAKQYNLAFDDAGAALLINGSGAAAYTQTVPIRPDPSAKYSLSYKASGTTPVVNMVVEHGNTVPAIECAASAAFAAADDVTAIEASLSDTVQHRKALAPDACAFVRLKILGLAGNGTNTGFSDLTLTIIGR